MQLHPREVISKEAGTVIYFKELQPKKTLFPIDTTEEGIDMLVNEEHSRNAQYPILVTEEGI